MKKLEGLKVSFLSLVDVPANRKTILLKGSGGSEEILIPIQKIDTERRLVYGTVYSPNEEDTQGDWADREEIRNAAYQFLKNGFTKNVDQQHDFVPDEGFVAESFILEKTDERFPDAVPGSWVVVIKVENEETWTKLKKGELTGISLAGTAKRIEQEINKGKVMDKIKSAIKSWWENLNKSVKERVNALELRNLIYAFSDEIYKILDDGEVVDKKAAIKAAIDEFLSLMDKTDVQKIGATSPTKEGSNNVNKQGVQPMSEITKEMFDSLQSAVEQLTQKLATVETAVGKMADLEKSAGQVADLMSRIEKIENLPLTKQSGDIDTSTDKKPGAWI